ncbi:MAG: hypothetical protein NZ851_05145 [Aquificaceae bacterium]|nr:hypothetical protein [Aquificaceae bacterium]
MPTKAQPIEGRSWKWQTTKLVRRVKFLHNFKTKTRKITNVSVRCFYTLYKTCPLPCRQTSTSVFKFGVLLPKSTAENR